MTYISVDSSKPSTHTHPPIHTHTLLALHSHTREPATLLAPPFPRPVRTALPLSSRVQLFAHPTSKPEPEAELNKLRTACRDAVGIIWLLKRWSTWTWRRNRSRCWRTISKNTANIRTGRRSCWSPPRLDCRRRKHKWVETFCDTMLINENMLFNVSVQLLEVRISARICWVPGL